MSSSKFLSSNENEDPTNHGQGKKRNQDDDEPLLDDQHERKKKKEESDDDEEVVDYAKLCFPVFQEQMHKEQEPPALTTDQVTRLKRMFPNLAPENLVTATQVFPQILDPKTPQHCMPPPEVVYDAFDVERWNRTPAQVFTIKCYYGDPDSKIPWQLKAEKKAVIQQMLQARKLPTDGTKKILLERLSTNLPYVVIEIDGRECLTNLVNTFLEFFEWDNLHLWEILMPRRGDIETGGVKLYETMNVDPRRLERNVQEYGTNLSQWNYWELNDLNSQLKKAGWSLNDPSTLQDLSRILADRGTIGPERKLQGSCSSKYPFWYSSPLELLDDPTFVASGGYLRLEDLALEQGDKLQVRYDFGDEEEFTLFIQSVESSENLLPLVQIHDEEIRVRARLVERGPCKMFLQYDGDYDL